MRTASQYFAASLLASLHKLGLRALVLAPGARSQALAIAAEQLAREGLLELTVALDERGAAFFALGRSLAGERPVAVLTTSGTAVANLHPAVLEAHHSGVPLLLLTADRPHEIRGLGANQTTAQAGIFGSAAREVFDVPAPEFEPGLDSERAEQALAGSAYDVAAAAWLAAIDPEHPGPVQLNLAFREPLAGTEPSAPQLLKNEPWMLAIAERAASRETGQEAPSAGRGIELTDPDLETLVIAGVQAGPEAAEFAERFRLPLLAEPSSGSRFGASVIRTYPKLLRERPALVAAVRRAIVFGRPTLDRQIIKLLREREIEVVVVDNPRSERFGLAAGASHLSGPPRLSRPSDGAFLAEWQTAERDLDDAVGEAEVVVETGSAEEAGEAGSARTSATGLTRAELAIEVWQASQQSDRLFFGASRLIREADSVLPPRPVSVFSNRGLAGIDGSVATVLGIASESVGGVTRALLGDLTLLHDAGSLALRSAASGRPVQLIIGNDGGGSIFEGLEMASWLDAEAFDRVFRTPQQVDLQALATAYGWSYRRITTAVELREALASAGHQLLDVALRTATAN